MPDITKVTLIPQSSSSQVCNLIIIVMTLSACSSFMFILLQFTVQGLHAQPSNSGTSSLFEASLRSTDEYKYAKAALDFVRTTDCDLALLTNPGECRHVKSLPQSTFVLYLAAPNTWARYSTKILERSRLFPAHDGVLVLDPYPHLNFGHLVLVFFIDFHNSKQQCNRKNGQFMGDGKCISPAIIPRCRTSLTLRRTEGHPAYRHCEHHFLPTVFFHSERNVGVALSQRLTCNPQPGFAPCPEKRVEKRQPLCDPLKSPNLRCSSLTDVSSYCPLDSTCDQAVLVSGGWNDDTNLVQSERNMLKVYQKLTNVGFYSKAVQAFFADGRSAALKETIKHNLHAAGGMKVAFRQHIQRICQTEYCMHNLVLYFNNPAFLDGSFLLWDSTADFEISLDEEYSADELKADLAQCNAKKILLFIDSNFADRVANRLSDVPNLTVLAASTDTEYARTGTMADVFFSVNSHLNTSTALAEEFARQNDGVHPRIYNAEEGYNVFGGELGGPVVAGCQSLPTSVLLQRMHKSG